jgi:glycosyltransferase involved in cell wall biosynthesis
MPIYNGEKVIKNSIKSILNQTYNNIEVILINDGSTDNTIKICEDFLKFDKRIKLINQKNAGPSTARNIGLINASGSLVQFVDADDQLKSNMVEKLVESFDEETDLIICGFNAVSLTSNKIKRSTKIKLDEEKLSKKKFLNNFIEYYDLAILKQPWNKMYKREVIFNSNILFNVDLKNAEDLIFNLRYYEKCRYIKIIESRLYDYYEGSEKSLTLNFKSNYFENRKSVYYEIIEFSKKNDVNNSNKFFLYLLKDIYYVFINYFHPNADYKKSEILNEIKNITSDEFIIGNIHSLKTLSFRDLFMKFLIINKKNKMIYYIFSIFSKFKFSKI